MKHAFLAIALAIAVIGCKSSSVTSASSPGETDTFKATLLPSNETPTISNAEQSSSGSVTVTFVVTRDSSNNILSVLGTAVVTMQGLQPDSVIKLAHIHTGATGVAGPVLVTFVPPAGSVALTGGAGSFTQSGPVTGDQATNIINNPASYYFNVHTALNGGGVMRGQLAKQ
jgi:hypothetical protein